MTQDLLEEVTDGVAAKARELYYTAEILDASQRWRSASSTAWCPTPISNGRPGPWPKSSRAVPV
jgi:hypothetical protein